MSSEKIISADALLKEIRDDPYIDGRAFARVKKHIEEAEDAVAHGAWHKYHDHFTKRQVGWICNNCSAVSYDLSNGDTPFCPHCGAMMDLEDDEDA